MDIGYLEFAAHTIFSLCRNHPELCPHYYKWTATNHSDTEDKRYYTCEICGNEKVESVKR